MKRRAETLACSFATVLMRLAQAIYQRLADPGVTAEVQLVIFHPRSAHQQTVYLDEAGLTEAIMARLPSAKGGVN